MGFIAQWSFIIVLTFIHQNDGQIPEMLGMAPSKYLVGDMIDLKCPKSWEFPYCLWIRNGDPVFIEGNRYRYKDPEKRTGGYDCSIVISPAKLIDTGQWSCVYPKWSHGYNLYKNVSATYHVKVENEAEFRLPQEGSSPAVRPEFVQQGGWNDTTPPGSKYIIPCLVNRPVHCFWEKNGIVMDPDYGFSYVNYNRVNRTTDCSVLLWRVSEKNGLWRCVVGTSDDIHKSRRSDIVTLNTDIGLQSSVAQEPRNSSIRLGYPFIFNCVFVQDAKKCDWKHWTPNGTFVDNESLRLYDTTENTCSLKFDYFSDASIGQWQCIGSNSKSNAIWTSGFAWLSVDLTPFPVAPKIVKHPRHALGVREGQKVELKCVFDSFVESCWWSLNDTRVPIGERKNTTDCTLVIPEVNRNFSGAWRCSDGDSVSAEAIVFALSSDEKTMLTESTIVPSNVLLYSSTPDVPALSASSEYDRDTSCTWRSWWPFFAVCVLCFLLAVATGIMAFFFIRFQKESKKKRISKSLPVFATRRTENLSFPDKTSFSLKQGTTDNLLPQNEDDVTVMRQNRKRSTFMQNNANVDVLDNPNDHEYIYVD